MNLKYAKYLLKLNEKLQIINMSNQQILEINMPIINILLSNQKSIEVVSQCNYIENNELFIVSELEDNIKVITTIKEVSDHIEIHNDIQNNGSSSIKINTVNLSKDVRIDSLYDRAYISDRSMVGYCGIFNLENNKDYTSYSLIGLTNSKATNSYLLGFKRFDDAFYSFNISNSERYNSLNIICDRENIELKPESTLQISPLLIFMGDSLSNQLEKYGQVVGDTMKVTLPTEVKTGWCSWYYYYGTESEQDIIDNVVELSNSPLKDKIKVIQIDDGWNLPYNGHDRVWGDWYPGGKFKKGMKHIVDVIHENNFEAGLWLAPFSVDINSRLAKEHPEWLIQSEDKDTLLNPATQFGIFGLDLTNPGALNFIKETFDRVFNEWGFDYVKTDFLEHGLIKGKRYDNSKTSVEAFRNGLEAINDVKKDRFLLTCGSPLAQAIGLCDGMRIGYDVGSKWYVPMNLGAWPHGNCSIVSSAYTALYRQWMHKKWWHNDPDCIVARDYYTEGELNCFNQLGCNFRKEDFGLLDDEVGFWMRLVWFTGGMKILSDVWSKLNASRQDLMEKVFSKFNTQDVMLVDYYENTDFVVMKTKEGNLKIGLFNLSDESREICLNSNIFDLKQWNFKEIFDGEIFVGEGETIYFPQIEKHAARVYELQ